MKQTVDYIINLIEDRTLENIEIKVNANTSKHRFHSPKP